jgi:hypothetical protein
MSQIGKSGHTGAGGGARTALRVTAVLSAVELIVQGATAGQILSGSEAAGYLHGAGAIVFHVLTGLMTISAALLWRAERGSVWPSVISLLVFLVGLLQAYLGDIGVLAVHVPLAIALTIATIWVLTWSFVSGRDRYGAAGAR